jgi:hypothetical protein
MKLNTLPIIGLLSTTLLVVSCDDASTFFKPNARDDVLSAVKIVERCPKTDFTPENMATERTAEEEPFVDQNRAVKDLGTEAVIKHLFTQQTLYRFMKVVYQTIDQSLAEYRKEKGLEDRALFILFKGGNVLRMVANEVFDQLTPEARSLLQNEYAQYFQRSDSDFSVYIDEKKLNGLDYDIVFDEVAKLVLAQLDKIRSEFEARPEYYFTLFRLNANAGQTALNQTFMDAGRIPAITDETNPNWFGAKFLQLRLRDYKATPGPDCFYEGQHDYRYEYKGDQMITTRLSTEPHWITNTDNRTLAWPWGSDPSKNVKFSLVRSKVAFEYTFEKDGVIVRKPIGGELIDVSLPHRVDDRLRGFLDNYDDTVREYTLISEEDEDQFTLKAYSFSNLIEDLQFIILDSFDRPWEGGPKYAKRVNRIFFLFNVELLSEYGLKNAANDYFDGLLEKVIQPITALYPLGANSKVALDKVKAEMTAHAKNWPSMKLTNHFFDSFLTLVTRIVDKPKEGDEEGMKGLLEVMEKNIAITKELLKLRFNKVNQEDLSQVETRNLF